jgi:hypothetical protein
MPPVPLMAADVPLVGSVAPVGVAGVVTVAVEPVPAALTPMLGAGDSAGFATAPPDELQAETNRLAQALTTDSFQGLDIDMPP